MKIDIYADNLTQRDCQHNPVLSSSWLILSNQTKIWVVRDAGSEIWRFPMLDRNGYPDNNRGLLPVDLRLEKSVEVTLYRLGRTEIRSYYHGSLSESIPVCLQQDAQGESNWMESLDLLQHLDEGPRSQALDSEIREADFVALINSF